MEEKKPHLLSFDFASLYPGVVTKYGKMNMKKIKRVFKINKIYNL